MNDFTKEELEWLHNTLSLPIEWPDGGWERIEDMQYKLVEKLKSILDNFYCEHEWQEMSVECQRYGCDTTFNKCKMCGLLDL